MDKIVKPILDFLKWLITMLKTGEVEPKRNLTAVYDQRRLSLDVMERTLLEFFEDDPEQMFNTQTIFVLWQTECVARFGINENDISHGEVRAVLKDWANNANPLVIHVRGKDGGDRWKLSTEYETFRTIPDTPRTIFREPTIRR